MLVYADLSILLSVCKLHISFSSAVNIIIADFPPSCSTGVLTRSGWRRIWICAGHHWIRSDTVPPSSSAATAAGHGCRIKY